MAKYYTYTDATVADIKAHIEAALTEANITFTEETSDADYIHIKGGTSNLLNMWPSGSQFSFSQTSMSGAGQFYLSTASQYSIYIANGSLVVRGSSWFCAITTLSYGSTSYVTAILQNNSYTNIRSNADGSTQKGFCSCTFFPSANKIYVFPAALTNAPSASYKSSGIFRIVTAGATLTNFTPYIINNEPYVHFIDGTALKYT